MRNNIINYDTYLVAPKEDGHSITVCHHKSLGYFLLDNENLVIDYGFEDIDRAISAAYLYEFNSVDYRWEVRL